MVFSLTWLPSVLEGAGLKVAEVDGWRSRGRAEMGSVRGVMCHHTAGAATGNMPTLDLLIKGRSDLSGPLAQLGLGRDGTYYVIAAGRANHAGAGRWRGIDTGNSSFIGIEAENTGLPNDAVWPAVQMDAYQRGVAAILAHIRADANMCCAHKEYALPAGRKNDPLFDMVPFRAAVNAILTGLVAPPPLIPAIDIKARPTLRRGDEGDAVRLLQQKLGLECDGRFGPGTEAAARQFQRDHQLVPDGIVGPKSWAMFDEAPTAAPPASAPLAQIAPIETISPVTPVSPMPLEKGTLPPLEDATHRVTVQGGKALTPDGKVFAKVFREGFYINGETSLAKWLSGTTAPTTGLRDSVVRVVRAMCVNEGGLEAVNSYDGCFMSAGIFQWTAGFGDEEGELSLLLSRFKAASPDAYQECFGRYQLEASVKPGKLTGHLVLNGRTLETAQDKRLLRNEEWAYRFWRAGHHEDFRVAQLALAASRIERFIHLEAAERTVSDWLTSQYGIALLLDQHVNRPGHVPKTLKEALEEVFRNPAVSRDPTAWTEADELRLIDTYIAFRERTSMTDSTKRARLIGECVRVGQLSDDRGSF